VSNESLLESVDDCLGPIVDRGLEPVRAGIEMEVDDDPLVRIFKDCLFEEIELLVVNSFVVLVFSSRVEVKGIQRNKDVVSIKISIESAFEEG